MSLYEIKYDKPYDPFVRFGCVIENNSKEDQLVDFLEGNTLFNMKRRKGVEITNMFSDSFVDEGSFQKLKHHLMAVGRLLINSTRVIGDDDLNRCTDGILRVVDCDATGRKSFYDINFNRFVNPHQHSFSAIDLMQEFLLSFMSTMNIVVKAGHKVSVMLVPKKKVKMSNDFASDFEKIKSSNSKFDSDKRRRYLTLLR